MTAPVQRATEDPGEGEPLVLTPPTFDYPRSGLWAAVDEATIRSFGASRNAASNAQCGSGALAHTGKQRAIAPARVPEAGGSMSRLACMIASAALVGGT